jgi:GT2 family glycosyltransferase
VSASLPTASVIVCAYTDKRWDDMQDAVDSAAAQPEATEVILVIDHNDELLAKSRNRWPHLTVIPNAEERGLSGARNTGVAAATSDLVIFLDDDAKAAPNWLAKLLPPFLQEDVVGVGGAALPRWPEQGSGPFPDELLWIVGCSYTGMPTKLAEVRNGLGASLAFRRQSILDVGGFGHGLGRIGTHPLGCEETELSIKIKQVAPLAKIMYEPQSVVRHRVTPERTNMTYLRRRSYYEGISKAILARRVGQKDSLSSESKYLTQVLPKALIRELAQIGRGGGIRATAIVTSVVATVAGYAVGRVVNPTSDAAPEPVQLKAVVTA